METSSAVRRRETSSALRRRETSSALRRRSVLMLPWLAAGLLAACVETPPPPTDFRPLDFSYLTKLRLSVAAIDVDSASVPRPAADGQHVEALAPVRPADALRQMAQERLIPAGSGGHAAFVIDAASVVQVAGRFEGNLQVHLDIASGDGTNSGYAEARVSRTRTIVDTSTDATRAALYELVKQMMDDMNVEFEFQVRRSLRDYLQSDSETAPTPAPVEQQDLSRPPATGAPIAPPPPTAPQP